MSFSQPHWHKKQSLWRCPLLASEFYSADRASCEGGTPISWVWPYTFYFYACLKQYTYALRHLLQDKALPLFSDGSLTLGIVKCSQLVRPDLQRTCKWAMPTIAMNRSQELASPHLIWNDILTPMVGGLKPPIPLPPIFPQLLQSLRCLGSEVQLCTFRRGPVGDKTS